MQNIKLFLANLVALLTGKAKVHSCAHSINGFYSYGRRDFGSDWDGEVKR